MQRRNVSPPAARASLLPLAYSPKPDGRPDRRGAALVRCFLILAEELERQDNASAGDGRGTNAPATADDARPDVDCERERRP
jgi:hypothetical protein